MLSCTYICWFMCATHHRSSFVTTDTISYFRFRRWLFAQNDNVRPENCFFSNFLHRILSWVLSVDLSLKNSFKVAKYGNFLQFLAKIYGFLGKKSTLPISATFRFYCQKWQRYWALPVSAID